MIYVFSMLGILIGYLLGSIPSALIVSRLARGVDIRTLGDGNLGARNISRTFDGWYGVIVGIADFCKGSLAVLISRWLGLNEGIQMLAGAAAVVGHDFPIFARFRGGQGLAATEGVMFALFPIPSTIGLIVYGLLFLITRLSNLAAAIGSGLIAVILGLQKQWLGLTLLVILFLSIPVKKWIDSPRKRKVESAEHKKSQV